MVYKFEVTEQSSQPVLSIRKTTSVSNLPKEIGNAYQDIITYLGELGLQPTDAPFAAYYNMDMDNLDVEMGFPVSMVIASKENIKSNNIPAGRQVSCMHKGPYQSMEPVYNAMMQWINDKGYEPTGVAYEFYYNSPMDVPESELLTKIVFPIK